MKFLPADFIKDFSKSAVADLRKSVNPRVEFLPVDFGKSAVTDLRKSPKLEGISAADSSKSAVADFRKSANWGEISACRFC